MVLVCVFALSSGFLCRTSLSAACWILPAMVAPLSLMLSNTRRFSSPLCKRSTLLLSLVAFASAAGQRRRPRSPSLRILCFSDFLHFFSLRRSTSCVSTVVIDIRRRLFPPSRSHRDLGVSPSFVLVEL
ncbi:hypothetical protein TGDOM2_364400 [Toxoplasma gondii GAB2-2007-GAL-DOM2]|uniref:Uncharacterized protein n=1 Tax=Toxoplasma gondii GAB2-2007-GAL-DOM2 TaxID=1130820 RepID=A0A086JJ24_TOXGO|nr:hypothetical protein TGDOM2_364400 [Toxoplasma gondii GAB2-2007-GAL-DOM2]